MSSQASRSCLRALCSSKLGLLCSQTAADFLKDIPSAGKLFDRYIQIERSLGNTEFVTALEKRRRDALGESAVSDINLMLLKYW